MSAESLSPCVPPAQNPESGWQVALDAFEESVCLLDAERRVRACNGAAERLTGRTRDQILGRRCEEIFADRFEAGAECPGQRALAGGLPVREEVHQGERCFEVLVTPLRAPSGEITGAVHRVTDVTARCHAEERLQGEQMRYRRLVDSVTDYLYTVRIEKGQAVETTHGPGCLGVTGYTAEEFAADPLLWLRMVPPEEQNAVLDHAARVVVDEAEGPLEHRIVHKDGTIRWVRNTPVPLHDADWRLVAYDGLVQDITAEKLAEEALRESEAFVRHILDAVDEAFIVIGRDYRILSCNRAYQAQTGLDARACAGRLCHEISHASAEPCWSRGEECAVRAVFETGEPHAAIHNHATPGGGALRVETKAFPLRDAAGEVVGAIEVINNISERVRLEEQLRQAQKMEAVGLLAGGVAHDFNNILSAIIGYGNLLELKLPRDSECRPYAEQILSAGERAASLTQSLLAFSRKQVINPRPLDLNEVIRKVEKLLRRVLGEDVELRTALAPGPLWIVADAGQIEQVLLNLVTNARDAMPEGGALTIGTQPCALDEQFVRANGFGAPGRYARIEVTDTGVGMSEEVRARIFEPFFTTKELGRGTGLGLAMVYGAVRQNRGHVAVASELGRGTTFRVWFPAVAEVAPQEAYVRAAPPPRGSGRILVVEDDPTVRGLLSAVLTEYGYEVVQAADGVEALALLERCGVPFDLCILDVVMPRLNGRETLERLRALAPGLKALFISGYTADIIHRRGILEEDLHFLSKPVSPQVLLAKVREVLDAPA